jgi:hypothetical protein
MGTRTCRTALLLGLAACTAPGATESPAGPPTQRLTDRMPAWADVELAAGRYAKVEAELAATDVSELTAQQRAARARTLAALHEYRVAADFGRSSDDGAVREHLFVDDDGRRCALAHLLEATGDGDLVTAVAAAQNGLHVIELAHDPRFAAWLDRAGLSAAEAARIQGPALPPPPPKPVETANVDPAKAPDGPRPSGGSGAVPGTDDVPAPSTPGAGRPTGGQFAGAGADAWWVWWELAKLDFLKPARERLDLGPRSAGFEELTAMQLLRDRAVAALVPLLRHDEPAVRAAAALAFGRIGSHEAVAPLTRLVHDDAAEVGEQALLGLGATGSPGAADALLQVLRNGRVAGARKDLPPSAAPVAVIALGIARRRGVEAAAAPAVVQALAKAKRRDLEALSYAAEVYASLAPGDAVVQALDRVAADRNAPEAASGKRLERLGAQGDVASIRVVQGALGDGSVHARRSAAATLGVVEHALVAPHLRTAVDLERDALTRGLGLISIGRRGGDGACAYLVEALGADDAGLRPWAALALGVLARDTGDAAARNALRTAELAEGSRGALWIARGLARDADAVPQLAAALRDAAMARARDHAAVALGLVGGDAAALALRQAALRERDPQVRAAIAVALAVQGNDRDAAEIVRAVQDADTLWLQPVLGVAAGFHRSRTTVDGLQAILENAGSRPEALAAAAEGLGLALDRFPAPALPRTSRATDFSLLPPWFVDLLRTTL